MPDQQRAALTAVLNEVCQAVGADAGGTLYLDDGTAWSACPQRRELEEALAAVTAAYNDIVNERDYPTNVGRHCSFCDYQSICPSREEIVGRRLFSGP